MDTHDSNEQRKVKHKGSDSLSELEVALKKFRQARRQLQHEIK